MLIPLGINPFTGKEVYFVEKMSWGNVIVGAVPRYGKSALVKTLVTHLSKYRRVVIFDYEGEWSRIQLPNIESKHGMTTIKDMKVLRNFAFKISDFDSTADWLAMGFPPVASREMSRIAAKEKLHKDDPDKFADVLRNLPTKHFSSKISDHNVHEASKESMITRFSFIKSYFKQPDDGKDYIYNFGHEMMQHHLCISLNLAQSQREKARAYVGKILEQMLPYLKYCHPAIVAEEADILAENMELPHEFLPSSVRMLADYSKKHQRYGMEMFYIVQNISSLYDSIVDNYHQMILGHVPSLPHHLNRVANAVHKLKWDADSNYRQFIYHRKGALRPYDIFVPYDCPCAC